MAAVPLPRETGARDRRRRHRRLVRVRDEPGARGRHVLRRSKGEFAALVGPNGSGEVDVAAHAARGAASRARARVRCFGEDPRELRDRWRIGYVPQRAQLPPDLPATVEEVVRGGPARAARMVAVAERELIATPSTTRSQPSRSPTCASGACASSRGGQQQRVLIAKALVGDPELLVLDEPIAGVDAESQRLFRDSLVHLADEHGATVLLVSHELGAVADDLDRVDRAQAHGRCSTARPATSRRTGVQPRRPRRRPAALAREVPAISMPWPFDRDYMQLALVAGLVVGACAPLIGAFLVQKRMSLMGDGLGHLAFAGVAAGLLFGVWPIWTALDRRRGRARSLIEWLRVARPRVGRPRARAVLLRRHRARGRAREPRQRGHASTCCRTCSARSSRSRGATCASCSRSGAIIVVTLLLAGRALFAIVLDEESARVAGPPGRRAEHAARRARPRSRSWPRCASSACCSSPR